MKKLSLAISALLLICLAAGVVTVAVPKLFGVKLFAVLSPSMEPELSPGDLVYAVPKDFEEIKTGDIISFVMDKNLTVATHRVKAVDAQGRVFTTKGDANDTQDINPVKYENVVGVVRFSIPEAGRLISKFSTVASKIILISIVISLSAVSVIFNSLADKNGSKKEEEHGSKKA